MENSLESIIGRLDAATQPFGSGNVPQKMKALVRFIGSLKHGRNDPGRLREIYLQLFELSLLGVRSMGIPARLFTRCLGGVLADMKTGSDSDSPGVVALMGLGADEILDFPLFVQDLCLFKSQTVRPGVYCYAIAINIGEHFSPLDRYSCENEFTTQIAATRWATIAMECIEGLRQVEMMDQKSIPETNPAYLVVRSIYDHLFARIDELARMSGMPTAPISAPQAEASGYTVDRHVYPHFAYKGERFAPSEGKLVLTDKEGELLAALMGCIEVFPSLLKSAADAGIDAGAQAEAAARLEAAKRAAGDAGVKAFRETDEAAEGPTPRGMRP